ncbi:MAG TPA: DUF3787 domain-containing protein [Mobilitalea sp.]|nr:DUF3787 domain-containing protein [Mobilitalea sp.]
MITKGNDNSNGKSEQLQGRDNKRLHTVNPTNSEGTAAWQNSAENYEVDLVNAPSLDRVVDAKDWVDNGSKL